MKIEHPSAEEIEAYYLGGSGLSPEVYAATERFVKEHYVDGGTRKQFIEQRERIEESVMKELDET